MTGSRVVFVESEPLVYYERVIGPFQEKEYYRMSRIIAVALLFVVIGLTSFVLQQKKKVVFFGDSITAAGVKPGGYIVKVGELAAKDKLANSYEFIGAGIGGNKVYDLYLRMDDDVLARKPDVVVIFVGVNDVWHKRSYGTGTDADKFEKFYTALINRMSAQQIKVVLCTPGAIGERTDFSNELDGDLNNYSNIIRRLAQQNNLPLIFFQIGGGIAGDFPICVVPMLQQDLQLPDTPRWGYFCQISDSTTSYGSYSGAVPNEKITWGKLSAATPKFIIESDATIVAPLMFAHVLGE
jgi:lysophospholipase L1-like esterase